MFFIILIKLEFSVRRAVRRWVLEMVYKTNRISDREQVRLWHYNKSKYLFKAFFNWGWALNSRTGFSREITICIVAVKRIISVFWDFLKCLLQDQTRDQPYLKCLDRSSITWILESLYPYTCKPFYIVEQLPSRQF